MIVIPTTLSKDLLVQEIRDLSEAYSSLFPRDSLSQQRSFMQPFVMQNVSSAEILNAIDDNGEIPAFEEISRRLSNMIIRGYGNSQTAVGRKFSTTTTDDLNLRNPVNIFGSECKDTADCVKAAGTFGLVCGLLGESVKYTSIKLDEDNTSLSIKAAKQPSWSRMSQSIMGHYSYRPKGAYDTQMTMATNIDNFDESVVQAVRRTVGHICIYALFEQGESKISPFSGSNHLSISPTTQGDDIDMLSNDLGVESKSLVWNDLRPSYCILRDPTADHTYNVLPKDCVVPYMLSWGWRYEDEDSTYGRLVVSDQLWLSSELHSYHTRWLTDLVSAHYLWRYHSVPFVPGVSFMSMFFDPAETSFSDLLANRGTLWRDTLENVRYDVTVFRQQNSLILLDCGNSEDQVANISKDYDSKVASKPGGMVSYHFISNPYKKIVDKVVNITWADSNGDEDVNNTLEFNGVQLKPYGEHTRTKKVFISEA